MKKAMIWNNRMAAKGMLDFTAARVLVVGDVMLDRYWYGASSRISPEAPVPVIAHQRVQECPGGAANVALNIAALGAKTQLLGLCGEDDAATALRGTLSAVGVDCHLIAVPGQPTITKLRIISQNKAIARVDFEQAFTVTMAEALRPVYRRLLEQVDVVVLSDYNKGTLLQIAQLISEAKAKGVTVLVDPKDKDWRRYRGADMLTPNWHEFEQAAGSCADEATLIERARAMMSEYSIGTLLITRGKQGMTLVPTDQAHWHIPSSGRDVYDVTGAGDTVVATLATALACRHEARTAALLASSAAGQVIATLGTSAVDALRLSQAMLLDLPPSGEVTVAQAQALALRLAVCQQPLIAVCGDFEVFHSGTADWLASARAEGKHLLVMLNQEQTIRQRTGREPLLPLSWRLAMLAEVDAVDWVLPVQGWADPIVATLPIAGARLTPRQATACEHEARFAVACPTTVETITCPWSSAPC